MRNMLAAAAALLAIATGPAWAGTLQVSPIRAVGDGSSTSRAYTSTDMPDGGHESRDVADENAGASAFPLDVAGVRLNMTSAEAKAALRRAGYSLRPEGVVYGPSFASQVRVEAERRRSGVGSTPGMTDRVITGLEAVGPNREAVTIGLAALPAGGSGVVRVHMVIPAEVMRGDAFLRKATSRYGDADGRRDMGLTLAWCSAPLRSVCASISPFQRRPDALPSLTATTVLNRNVLLLKDGTDQDRAREQARAAAVERAAPTIERAAF